MRLSECILPVREPGLGFRLFFTSGSGGKDWLVFAVPQDPLPHADQVAGSRCVR